MGCWNETCMLTRTPIAAGMPVVAFTKINGMEYRSMERVPSLLFGMPIVGEYDDYGGVENIVNEKQQPFERAAFLNSGFYKEVMYDGEYTDIAANSDVFWSLSHELQQFFHQEYGLYPSQIRSHDESSQKKRSMAYVASEEALNALGAKLEKESFENQGISPTDRIFEMVSDVYGEQRAWPVYEILCKKGLYANTSEILMHKAAYDALVDDFGTRKVKYYGEKQSYSIREYVEMTLAACIKNYNTEFEKWNRILSRQADLSDKERHRKALDYIRHNESEVLAPLTRPWLATNIPLIGHYWGGASFEKILEVIPYDHVIDYLVFQWAINYTRIDIRKPGLGSQCTEGHLQLQMAKAMLPVLKEYGLTGKDFDGTLFRR